MLVRSALERGILMRNVGRVQIRRCGCKKKKGIVDQEGFQQVGYRKVGQEAEVNEVQVHNPFYALLEATEENGKEDETTKVALEDTDSSRRRKTLEMGDTGDGQGLITPLPNG